MNLDFTKMDFDEVKNALKDSLRNDGVITDFDYEGSNTDTLLNILSYVTTMINHNINYVSNEAFLATAESRKNVLKHAKSMGYRVERKTSAKFKVFLRFGLEPYRKLTIPKYTQFYTSDKTQFLNTDELYYVNNSADYTFFNEEITLTEGELIDYKTDPALNFSYDRNIHNILLLKYKNIEDTGIEIIVNDSYVDNNIYLESTDLINDIQTMKKVFTSEYDPETEYVRVKFLQKYSIAPDDGDDVKIFLVISKGVSGNNYKALKSKVINDQSINTSDTSRKPIEITIWVNPNSDSYGGSDEEDNDSIKNYAPVFKSSGSRAITSLDWEAIMADIPTIKDPSVWGGEEIGDDITNTDLTDEQKSAMKRPGYVYMTGRPSSGEPFFERTVIESIRNTMAGYSVLALRKVFLQPVFINAEIQVDVIKDPSYKYIQDDITNEINEIIDDIFSQPFDFTYKKAKLINTIYSIDGVDSVSVDDTRFIMSLSSENFYFDVEEYLDMSLPYTGVYKDECDLDKITTANPDLFSFGLVDIPDGLDVASLYDFDYTKDTFLDHIGIQSLFYPNWDSTKDYVINEKVFYDDGTGDKIYVALTPNTNVIPTDGVVWEYIPQTSNYMDKWGYPIDFADYKRIVFQFEDLPLWDDVTNYVYGEYVTYEGYYYKCITSNTGELVTETDFWELLSISAEQVALGEFIIGTYMKRENIFRMNNTLSVYQPLSTVPDTYSNVTTYNKGDLVEYSGVYYICRVDGSLDKTPDVELEDWVKYGYSEIWNRDIFSTPYGFYFDDLGGSFDTTYLTFKRESMVSAQSKLINFL